MPPRSRLNHHGPTTVIYRQEVADAVVPERWGDAFLDNEFGVVRRYLSGETMAEIAPSMGPGVSRGMLGDYMSRVLGFHCRRSGRTQDWSDTDSDLAKVLWDSGLTADAIAGQLGTTATRVVRKLKLVGVDVRRRRKPFKVDDQGYVHVWIEADDPMASMATKSGDVLEHRLVVARTLGRPLLPFPLETVHHINGVRSDNRIDNLQLRFGGHGVNVAARCRCCGSIDVEFVPLGDG